MEHIDTTAADQLRQIVERIEAQNERIAEEEAIEAVYREALGL